MTHAIVLIQAERSALPTLGGELAEETRLGMLVGVAVGFELARELTGGQQTTEED